MILFNVNKMLILKMIVTKNADFLLIPKTGTSWLQYVISPIITDTLPDLELPTDKSRPAYTFVRNPWAWYVSNYNYERYGSSIKSNPANRPTYKAFGKDVDFGEYLSTMISPSREFKESIIKYEKLELLYKRVAGKEPESSLEFFEYWLTSEKSMYNIVFDYFLEHATYIGKTENMQDDLKKMLVLANELTPEVDNLINNTPAKNASATVDYRAYYTPELREMVYNNSRDTIERFEYTF